VERVAPAVERLRRVRRDLLALLGDLEREAAAIAESTAESPDDEHDAEGSTVGYERARVAALLGHARATLAELDAALERAAAGTYGICEGCSGPIGEERLVALPAAVLCVRCAGNASARLRAS
jgi:DnaK suppressor protein